MRWIVAVVLAWSPVAVADDEPTFDRLVHWQLEPLFRFGSTRLDGQGIGQMGYGVDAAVRYDRLALALDLAEMDVSWDGNATPSPVLASGSPTPTSGSGGTMDRIGATLRVLLARMVDVDAVADAWIGAGVGLERFDWDVGGHLTRRDVNVELGALLGGHGDHWDGTRRRWWGSTGVVLHVIYAPRVDGIQPTACGGPCDVATRPSGYDRSIYVDWSFPFGK